MLHRRTPSWVAAAVPSHPLRALAATLALASLAACTDRPPTSPDLAPGGPAAVTVPTPRVVITNYDATDLDDYQRKWSNPYGRLELDAGGTMTVSRTGGVTVDAVPFHVGADVSVYDHLKYIGISTQSFPVPANGSLTFSVEITATTPGAAAGRVIHGCYGPSWSWDGSKKCKAPWSATTLQGQQAGVVLNMVSFATGQLFDWFVAGNEVFALIERLPSNVTGSPGVGLDKAYTQIVKSQPIAPGGSHVVAITYTRSNGSAKVEYFLDGALFAAVDRVGVPLDVQGVPYSGVYPSLGPGEPLANAIDSFVIGHGLFSLLDAFPFQHPDRPDLSVSVPMSERLFGQGATGTWRNLIVRQVSF